MLNVYDFYEQPEELLLYSKIYKALGRLSDFCDEEVNEDELKPVMHIIERYPDLAYTYAIMVLKGRFVKCEPMFMKHPKYAYIYARHILANDPEWTSRLEHENGRWPEAEPYIMKNPFDAYIYALNIIKGRWPEAEHSIIKDPEAAVYYAIYVMKKRWPEAEPTIMSNDETRDKYESVFGSIEE